MRTPEELLLDLKKHLEGSFQFVSITAAQVSEQIQQEVRSCGKHRLPAVLIVFDRSGYIEMNTINELSVTLVIVDSFIAGIDAMAMKSLKNMGVLQQLFPPEGCKIGGAFCTPGTCYPASADATFVCFAQELTLRQGV